MSLADEIYKKPTSRAYNQPVQPGLAIAKVVDIKDPDKLGRVKCQCLTEDKANELEWCYVMSPYAGKSYGIQFMPDVGDMVVIGYIGGDRYSPLVMGCLWCKEIPMPYDIKDGKNESFCIKTPSNAEISFTGEKGREVIKVVTPAGTSLVMDDEKKALDLQDKDGKNAIKIDLKNGQMEITADKKIVLKTGSTSLALDGSGKAELTAKSSIKLDAASVEAKAKNSFKAEGATVEIKSKGKLDINSTGVASVKGSVLKLN